MTEKSLFKVEGAKLPDYLTGELDDIAKSIVGPRRTGGKHISIKGSVFRQYIDGEEKKVSEDRAMNVVIVNCSTHVQRTFYADVYEEGAGTPPACWSEDGMVPHNTVPAKQSESCAVCEKNIAGSGRGTSRACKYSRRVAVVLEGDLSGYVYAMQFPATTIFGKGEPKKLPFEQYIKALAEKRVPVTAVVTEIKFDPSSATPKLTFRAIKPLEADEWALCGKQGATEDSVTAVEAPKYAQWIASKDTGDPETTPEPVAVAETPTKRAKIAPVPIAKNKIEAELDGWDD